MPNLFVIRAKEVILFFVFGTLGLFLGALLNYPQYGNLTMITYTTASICLIKSLRVRVRHMVFQNLFTFGAILGPISIMALFNFGFILPNAPDSHLPTIIIFATIQTMLSSTTMFLTLPKLNVLLVTSGVSLLSLALIVGSLYFYASYPIKAYLYAHLMGQTSNILIVLGLLDFSKIQKW